jgi:hypothetical protein
MLDVCKVYRADRPVWQKKTEGTLRNRARKANHDLPFVRADPDLPSLHAREISFAAQWSVHARRGDLENVRNRNHLFVVKRPGQRTAQPRTLVDCNTACSIHEHPQPSASPMGNALQFHKIESVKLGGLLNHLAQPPFSGHPPISLPYSVHYIEKSGLTPTPSANIPPV